MDVRQLTTYHFGLAFLNVFHRLALKEVPFGTDLFLLMFCLRGSLDSSAIALFSETKRRSYCLLLNAEKSNRKNLEQEIYQSSS